MRSEVPQPFGNRIAVVEIPEQEQSSGLYLPSGSTRLKRSMIIAVGDVITVGSVLNVGDVVWHHRDCGDDIYRRQDDRAETVTIMDAGCVVAVEPADD